MNESFPSSAGPGPDSTPSLNDRRDLPTPTAQGSFVAAFGQALLLGFVGQIVFTVLQVNIAGNTHSKTDVGAAITQQILLLGLPLLCAIGGALDGFAHPSSKVAHPLSLLLLALAVTALGAFNLIVMVFTGMPGYC